MSRPQLSRINSISETGFIILSVGRKSSTLAFQFSKESFYEEGPLFSSLLFLAFIILYNVSVRLFQCVYAKKSITRSRHRIQLLSLGLTFNSQDVTGCCYFLLASCLFYTFPFLLLLLSLLFCYYYYFFLFIFILLLPLFLFPSRYISCWGPPNKKIGRPYLILGLGE